jgi:hypothetical protein
MSIIHRDTSIVPVDTRYLQGGESYIVYISSTDVIGQIVSVYDIFGHLSSPQTIVISSLYSTFTHTLYQRYSYMTLQNVSNNSWKIIYENAISDTSNYSMRGISYILMESQSINISNLISSAALYTHVLNINSSFRASAPLICSTCSVNNSLQTPECVITGSVYNRGDYAILSSIRVEGAMSVSSAIIQGPLSTLADISVGGQITYSSNLWINGSISTSLGTIVDGQLSTGGQISMGSAIIQRNMVVSSINANAINAFALITNALVGQTMYHTLRSDISVVDPTYSGPLTPVVEVFPGLVSIPTSILDWTTASYLRTDSLVISNAILAPTLSSFIMNNASISAGSLHISSIQAQTLAYTTLLGPGGQPNISSIGTNTITASSNISSLYAITCGNINSANIYSGLLHNTTIRTSTLLVGDGTLATSNLTLSTLFITSATNTNSLSSIVISNAGLQVDQIYTGTMNTNSTIISSLQTNGINSATTFRMNTPEIQISSVNARETKTNYLETEQIIGRRIDLGTPLQYSTINSTAVYLIPSTTAVQTRYEYVNGLGTIYSPIRGVASTDRIINLYPGNTDSFLTSYSTSYLNVEYTYTNNGSASGSSGLRIMNSNSQSTIVSFNANPISPIQRKTLYNYPIDRNITSISTIYSIDGINSGQPPQITNSQKLVSIGNGTGSIFFYSHDGGTAWTEVNTNIFNITARVVVSNGQIWLAGGQGTLNTLAYSYTGTDWYGLGLMGNINTITWNGTQWLLGMTGGDIMATSYNGIAWTAVGSPFTSAVHALATNGTLWVAGGQGGYTMAYSYNLIGWIPISNTFTRLYGLGTNGTEWVAVGEGTSKIAHSYDGIAWSSVVSPFTTRGLCVEWNGGQWVAGGVGTYEVAYSSNGINWTGVSLTSPITSITHTDQVWVGTTSAGDILKSTNGITWSTASTGAFSSGGTSIASFRIPSFTEFLCTTSPSIPFKYSMGRKRWINVVSIISGQVNSYAWNGRRWLAGLSGGDDTLAYSDDGVNWTGLGKFVFTTECFQIAWNGYRWIAVGTGTNTLATSVDGLTWTGLGTSIFSTQGRGVAVGGGKVVATGTGTNTLAYSYDGTTWTGIASPLITAGRKLVYSGTRWVAGGTGANTLIYSDNGISWTAASVQPFLTETWDIATNGSAFVAVGDTTKVAYSTDGNTWTSVTISNSGKGVTWTGTRWAITGASAGDPIIYVSTDGLTWSSESPTQTGPAYTLATRASSIPFESVMIGCGGSTMAITNDGYYWTPVTHTLAQAYCVAWNGSMWVAGGSGTDRIVYSMNGIDWSPATTQPNMTNVQSLTWGSKWVAVGEGPNTYATSTDGLTWTSYNATFVGAAYGIIYAQGQYIAAGVTTGGLATSSDGVIWTAIGGSLFSTGRSVAINETLLVAVGEGLNTLAVNVGLGWIGLGTTIFSVSGYAVAFGKGVWVALGEGTNTIAISTDGFRWVGLGSTIFTTRGTGITWNGSIFVATGTGTNTLATSGDGITWIGQGSTTFPGSASSVSSRRSSPYVATAIKETIVFHWSVVGTAVISNQASVRKLTSGSAAWDSVAFSTDGFTQNIYFSCKLNTRIMCLIGLSENPSVLVSSVNYGFMCSAGGQLDIYEVGFYVTTAGSYNAGDTLQIQMNGTTISYFKNNVLIRNVTRAIGASLYAAAIIYTPGGRVDEIEFNTRYRITTASVPESNSNYIVRSEPIISNTMITPLYFSLLSDLPTSSWLLNISLSGNVSTSLYADIYINNTRYFSTNTIETYVSTLSTYQFSFDVPDRISVVSGDIMNIRFMGTKQQGDLYFYGSPISSSIVFRTGNPNGFQYLQFFHTSPQGLQTSELAAWISPLSTMTTTYMDSNNGIEMNRGYMKWMSSLQGVTIQNRFNDISTRSLLYTGAIYNASDKNLKRDIEYISSENYVDTFMAIPLRRFTFTDMYCSTFQIRDHHQLGVITSEVKEHFPEIVHTTATNIGNLSTIEMVDRGQLRYLHLSATQELIKRVSTLSGQITHLRYLSSLVEAKSG